MTGFTVCVDLPFKCMNKGRKILNFSKLAICLQNDNNFKLK